MRWCLCLGLLLSGACSSSPTSVEVDLTLDAAIRFVEISGRNPNGSAVFPLSAVTIAEDVQEGSVVIVLPEQAPTVFELGVRGLSQNRDAMVTWTQTVTIAPDTLNSFAVTLGLPNPCPVDGCVLCGDGRIEAGESCDDQNTAPDDGCNSNCSVEPGYGCDGEPSVCREDVTPPACGNGQIEAGEDCDDGNTVVSDGCSPTCSVEQGFSCVGQPSVCTAPPGPPCGDGQIEGQEECDDNNVVTGDGCDDNCRVEMGFECSGMPSNCTATSTAAPPVCGDGVIDVGEECDDNNTMGGDGCDDACAVEMGFACAGEPSVCQLLAVCGNGLIEMGEECDDNNRAPGDGCRTNCRVDSGFVCTGEPSVCVADCSLPCGPSCPASGCCSPQCNSGACDLVCPSGCYCELDCSNSASCEVACRSGSTCNIQCDGSGDCSEIACHNGASCQLNCGTAMSCGYDMCQANEVDCGNNVYTCNAACP